MTISGRQYNLNREENEEVGNCLSRIKQNLMKANRKKGKKGKDRAADDDSSSVGDGLNVELFESQDGGRVHSSTPNGVAWAKAHSLRVGETLLAVDYNLPTVEKLSVTTRPVLGIPIMPSAKVMFADEGLCQWRWFRREAGKKGLDWQPVGCSDRMYTPSYKDRGCILPPRKAGGRAPEDGRRAVVDAVTGQVEDGPQLGPGASRHTFTPTALSAPAFRVVSYNVLADQYVRFEKSKASKPKAQRKDLFWFCPIEYLDLEYRKQLIAAEVMGFHPDIICMQEVDSKAFEAYYEPYFASLGFEGIFTKKAGKVEEGCAAFVRRSRFKIEARKDIAMRDLFRAPFEGAAAEFAPLIEASPKLAKALQKVGTIGQIAVLVPTADFPGQGPLCLANTHLFFHPDAGHIRTLHTAALVKEAAGFASEFAGKGGGGQPALVLCGDLNSDLNDEEGVCGAVQMLVEGRLSANHWEWSARAGFDWDRNKRAGAADSEGSSDEEDREAVTGDMEELGLGAAAQKDGELPAVTGLDVAMPVPLASADQLSSDFTNFVEGYQALLDYCWYQSDVLEVHRFIPLPSRTEVEGFCPSARWPSDHLSVVADLSWKGAGAAPSDPPCPRQEYLLPAETHNITKGLAPLMQGGVIALPTDTLYGVACCAGSKDGIQNVYDVKGRPKNLPLAICVGEISDVYHYGKADHLPDGLLQELLPGPTTVILERRSNCGLSEALNPGVSTIGIRIPDSTFVRSVCQSFGRAIALTSANASGKPSSVELEDFRELW
eukprot:CAMPEP_0177586746 /NCGR_PEP_ID=MMETSP0419_2-20121207/5243_1 /TAXON_ID=582737 /ORGANISM="Tetraselmis sp., Strain GSL018" /LENGTH=772 /DNA_ID=CAMNT_0019076671 /DNA_START=285 /DNA_END=2601 /DNA_ORIENTATION=+